MRGRAAGRPAGAVRGRQGGRAGGGGGLAAGLRGRAPAAPRRARARQAQGPIAAAVRVLVSARPRLWGNIVKEASDHDRARVRWISIQTQKSQVYIGRMKTFGLSALIVQKTETQSNTARSDWRQSLGLPTILLKAE